jgi:hypothetical protein
VVTREGLAKPITRLVDGRDLRFVVPLLGVRARTSGIAC